MSTTRMYPKPTVALFGSCAYKERSFQCMLQPCPEVGERCPVFILDTYLSRLPPKARENDLFYLRPLSEAPSDVSAPWYAAVPVGKDTLQNKLSNMCKKAGISDKKINHSLRAASATQMYDSGVPEKLIQERTGHRSLEALRMYERTNAQQHQAISAVLSAPHSTLYHQASEKRTLSHTVSEVQPTQHAPSSLILTFNISSWMYHQH